MPQCSAKCFSPLTPLTYWEQFLFEERCNPHVPSTNWVPVALSPPPSSCDNKKYPIDFAK